MKPLELGFDPNSRIGELYQDVISEYVKSIGTEDEFWKDINRGCTDSFMYIPVHTNDLTKAESCEVAGIAYRYKELHPYLVKHGYSLPIGMNDYDPATKIDDGLRAEIDSMVQKVVQEVSGQGYERGTKEFVTNATRRIYDWGAKRLDFEKDCEVEPADWEAMNGKCGHCTEISAIMNYALSKAGLDPQFMLVDEYPPTVENFNEASEQKMFSGDERISSHVFVGVPIPGEDSLLHVDVSMERFDAKYKYAKVLTPRQFVVGWHYNRAQDFAAKGDFLGMIKAAVGCLDITSNDPICLELKLRGLKAKLSEDQAGGEINEQLLVDYNEAEKVLLNADIDEQPGKRVIAEFYSLAKASTGIAGIRNILRNVQALLGYISEKDPAGAAKLAVGFAYSLEENITQALKLLPLPQRSYVEMDVARIRGMEFELLMSAIDWNPNYMNAYLLLDNIVDKIGNHEEAYLAFGEFAEEHPEVSLGHYLKAFFGLAYASGLFPKEAEPVLENVRGAIEKADQIEPGNIGSAILKSHLARFQKRYEEGIEILSKIKVDRPGLLSYQYYQSLLALYISVEDYKGARDAVNRFIELSAFHGRSWLAKFVRSYIANADIKLSGSQFSVAVVGDVQKSDLFNLVEWVVDRISEEDAFKDVAARQLYALILVCASLNGDEVGINRLLKKMGGTVPPLAKRDMDNFVGRFADFGLEVEGSELRKNVKDRLNRCAYVLKQLKGIFTPISDYPGFNKLCLLSAKLALFNHDVEKAGEYMKLISGIAGVDDQFRNYVVAPILISSLYKEKKFKSEDIKLISDMLDLILLVHKDSNEELVSFKGLIEKMFELYESVGVAHKKQIGRLINRLKARIK